MQSSGRRALSVLDLGTHTAVTILKLCVLQILVFATCIEFATCDCIVSQLLCLLDYCQCQFSYYMYIVDGFGAWDSSNCRVLRETAEEVDCGCDHLTHFAILLVSDSSCFTACILVRVIAHAIMCSSWIALYLPSNNPPSAGL